MNKILLASHPFDGHFQPFTQLATQLQRRGYDVSWYTGGSYGERIARLGIRHYPFVRAKEITADNLAQHIPGHAAKRPNPKHIEAGVRAMFFEPIEPQFCDVRDIYQNHFRFDAFICDAAMYMSRMVAERLQPRVYVMSATLSPAPTSKSAPAPFFGFKPARSLLGRVRDRAVHRLLARTTKSGLVLLNDFRRREGLPPYQGSPFDLHVERSRAIFQIGVPGLDFPRDDWPANFRFIGALLPKPTARDLPAGLVDKLERYRSLVVVSQGTTDNHDANKLFVPTLQAMAGSNHLVVATTGGRHSEALRRRFPHDNVVIEDWIDFHALLARANVFICNGGFGSVLLALSNGVPLVLAGKSQEKADINARLDYRKLGVDLRTERPSPDQIERGVARVVGDARIASRVADLRAELAHYRPLELIEQVLAEDGVTPTLASASSDVDAAARALLSRAEP